MIQRVGGKWYRDIVECRLQAQGRMLCLTLDLGEAGTRWNQRGEYWMNLYCLWPEEPPREVGVFAEDTESLADVVVEAGLMGRHDLMRKSLEGGSARALDGG